MSVSAVPKEFLSSEECKALFNKILSMSTGGGVTNVSIMSSSTGSARWVRNRIQVASDIRSTHINIIRSVRGATGVSSTSCLDNDSLLQAIRDAETLARATSESAEQIANPYINQPILNPTLWSEDTYRFGAEARADLVQRLMIGAEDAGLMSTGNLQISANGTATMSSNGMFRYYPQTAVECSMTVRNSKGSASGWAGVNHYDLGKIDPKALAEVALEKGQRSVDPVAVEPGRYTVIMEPQATADLFSLLPLSALDRSFAEMPAGPFGKSLGSSKINERVLDRRIVVSADPMDPDGGFLPYASNDGTPYQPVVWIDEGVLRELSYYKRYALAQLGLDKALPNPGSFRLAPDPGVPTTTVEEMIATTERGILVTRFSNVQIIDIDTMLCSGYTRDGTWLIERGKITKPVKNFRFTESPLFAFNNLEDIGVPQRVFAPQLAFVAPPVRVRDFSLTSLADAI